MSADDGGINNQDQMRLEYLLSDRYSSSDQELDLNNLCEDWERILAMRDWSKLNKLTLSQCKINDANIAGLMKYNLLNLSQLQLSFNSIALEGVRQLQKSDWPNLKSLWLCINENKINSEGVKLIFQKFANNLLVFSIGSNSIVAQTISLFLHYDLSALLLLDLDKNNIGSIGSKILSKVNFPKLKQIRIHQCQIGNEGLKHLSKSSWHQLQSLNIGKNGINLYGFQSLSLQNWTKLNRFCFVGYFGDVNSQQTCKYSIEILQIMLIKAHSDLKMNRKADDPFAWNVNIVNTQMNAFLNQVLETKFIN